MIYKSFGSWRWAALMIALLLAMLASAIMISRLEAQAAYGKRQPLYVTTINGITSGWNGDCAAGVLDNRSTASRQLDYIGVYAAGVPSWTVTLNYSDNSCSGPWSTFGSAASINDGSAVPVAYGFGYHPFVQIVVSGPATVSLSGTRGFYPPIH